METSDLDRVLRQNFGFAAEQRRRADVLHSGAVRDIAAESRKLGYTPAHSRIIYSDVIGEPETFAEAFLSVPLTEGKHDIELIYTTPGLKTGAMISLGCLIFFLLSAFWRGKQEKNIVVSESLC